MAIWAAAVGCAIALLTRSFGHLFLSRENELKNRERICKARARESCG